MYCNVSYILLLNACYYNVIGTKYEDCEGLCYLPHTLPKQSRKAQVESLIKQNVDKVVVGSEGTSSAKL